MRVSSKAGGRGLKGPTSLCMGFLLCVSVYCNTPKYIQKQYLHKYLNVLTLLIIQYFGTLSLSLLLLLLLLFYNTNNILLFTMLITIVFY